MDKFVSRKKFVSACSTFSLVHLSLAQAGLELLHSHIDVHDFIRTIEERIGNRLAHADTRDATDRIVQRFEMLDIHGGEHTDAGNEQVEHVLVALLAPTARGIGVGELVDDAHLWLACEDRVDIHLFEHDAAVLDLAFRNDLEVAYLRVGVGAPVGLDEPDDDVNALAAEGVRILEHRIGLADARRGADINAQPCTIGALDPRQQLLTGGTCGLVHVAHRTCSS